MDYLKIEEVKISMEVYLREILDEFPEEIPGRDETPAAKYLFEIRISKVQVMLDEPRAQTFHNPISQLLFTSTRCRKGIHTEV